jgi:ATP-binding cassette subfamily F protein uup
MAKLQAEAAAFSTRLADAALYARDPAGFDKLSQALARTQASLATAEEEWLRLEMLREEING